MRDDPLWYKDAIFYELYIRAFYDSNGDGHGDLQGVIEKLDYLKELGIDCIWLLPFYPSPLKDDGYDIADYTGIHPDYGRMEDFERLIHEAHSRGLRVITDMVLSHTSDQHPWFQAARSSRDNPQRDWYVWSDTDQRYRDARIIFLDTEKSNWTYDPHTGQYYWHRFYASQPDLNYDTPQVREAIKSAMAFWLNKGIDGFRVDAVPYLFEREGSNCENLPETHTYLRDLRRFVSERWPNALLLAEANQLPEDLLAYFGAGDEFHMAFHFPLMTRLFMTLKAGDANMLRQTMEATPPIPDSCQWCTFLRNHDELTLEMVTEQERQWMWEVYAPDPRMRLNLGIRRRLTPLLDNDPRQIMLANAIVFSLPGAPTIYYGDEIGMGDNIDLPDRMGVRTPMQWSGESNAGFSTAPHDALYAPIIDDAVYGYRRVNVEEQRRNPNSVYHQMRRLIQLRKQYHSLSKGTLEWLTVDNPTLAVFLLRAYDQTILIVHNLSAESQATSLGENLPADEQAIVVFDSLGRVPGADSVASIEALSLAPFQSLWFLMGAG